MAPSRVFERIALVVALAGGLSVGLRAQPCELPAGEEHAILHYLKFELAFSGRDLWPRQTWQLQYLIRGKEIVWYLPEHRLLIFRRPDETYSFGELGCYVGSDMRDCIEKIMPDSSHLLELLAQFKGGCKLWLRPEQIAPWAPSPDSEEKRQLVETLRAHWLKQTSSEWECPLLIVANDFHVDDPMIFAVIVSILDSGEVYAAVYSAFLNRRADPPWQHMRQDDLVHETTAPLASKIWQRPLLLYPVHRVGGEAPSRQWCPLVEPGAPTNSTVRAQTPEDH